MDKKIFGQTVTPQEAERAEYLVCIPVAALRPIETMPPAERAYAVIVRARSQVEYCSACGCEVLVDSVSPRTPKRICLPCIMPNQFGNGATVQ